MLNFLYPVGINKPQVAFNVGVAHVLGEGFIAVYLFHVFWSWRSELEVDYNYFSSFLVLHYTVGTMFANSICCCIIVEYGAFVEEGPS